MVELKCPFIVKTFDEMLDGWAKRKYGIDQIWKAINDVKVVPIIPGLNIITTYQLAEYFGVSNQSIKRIHQRHISGTDSPLRSCILGANMLKEFSVSWETLETSEGRRIKIDYPKFSILIPPSGIICFPAMEILTFISNLKGSSVNSKIIENLIRSSPRNGSLAPYQTKGDKLFEWLLKREDNEDSTYTINSDDSKTITIIIKKEY